MRRESEALPRMGFRVYGWELPWDMNCGRERGFLSGAAPRSLLRLSLHRTSELRRAAALIYDASAMIDTPAASIIPRLTTGPINLWNSYVAVIVSSLESGFSAATMGATIRREDACVKLALVQAWYRNQVRPAHREREYWDVRKRWGNEGCGSGLSGMTRYPSIGSGRKRGGVLGRRE